MRITLVCCLALALVSSSCRKKTYEAFYKLEAQQSSLISNDGDDAYLSPEMDVVLAGLAAVPENAREKERADALLAKLTAEKQRVQAERAAPPPTPSEPAAPPPLIATVEPVKPAPVAAAEGPVDAGPPQPFAGMSEKAFLAAFGACFSSGPATTTQDGGAATGQVVKNDADCIKRFGTAGATTTFLFTSAGLIGKRTETTSETKKEVKPEPTAAPKPTEPPPEPQPVLRIMGAPQPVPPDAG